MAEEELEDLEEELPTPEELAEATRHYDAAVERVRGRYQGIQISIGKTPQTARWSTANMQAALSAVGGADSDSVKISSRLLDPKLESVAGVNHVISAINKLKKDPYFTLPHVRPGLRLVRLGENGELLDELQSKLTHLGEELAAAAKVMAKDMPRIRSHMQAKLRRAYEPANYDFDPRDRCTLDWAFRDVDVPSYLRHNKELFAREEARVKAELRSSIQMQEAEMASCLFETLDRLAERLESRRLLDGRHDVISVREDGDVFQVTYREKQKDGGPSPEREVSLSAEELAQRVTEDTRRKTFTDATAARLFDELEQAKFQLQQNGIGDGPLKDAYQRLQKMVARHDRESLPKTLKTDAGFREAMRKQVARIGESVLGLAVIRGKRDVLRGQAKSRINPTNR